MSNTGQDKGTSTAEAPDFSGYAFVASPIEFVDPIPFEILPEHCFQRASPEQISRIREVLAQHNPFSGFSITTAQYETEGGEVTTASGVRVDYQRLPMEQWRYNVVTFSPNNRYLGEIEEASNLSDVPLELPFFFMKGGQGGHAGHLATFVSNISLSDKPTRVTVFELEGLRKVFEELRTVGHEYPEFKRAASMFDSLKLLPRHSEFRVLGLFAIIEMLITHNPKLEDRGDSITHQMKSKVPLVSRRFTRPLNYHAYFGGCTEDDVWGCLYSYRSALAHGGVPDFENKHKLLRNGETTRAFLREAVKLLLRHGLNEPQLYRDLREC